MILSRFSLRCVAFCVALVPVLMTPHVSAREAYAVAVEAGASSLRAGEVAFAGQALSRAIRLDANEPTAWAAYGTLLLDTSNVRDARAAFSRALSLNPEDELAKTGLALCDLDAGNVAGARLHVPPATDEGGNAAKRLREYLDAISSGSAPDAGAPLAPRHWPITASYNSARPMYLRWTANPGFRLPATPRETVKGRITLVAPSASSLTMATFDIDGEPAGMTNVTPCTWAWDTAQWPDGWHFIRIVGTRAQGADVVRERWVVSSNSVKRDHRSRPDLMKARTILDEALTVHPDPRVVHLSRAKAALSAGKTDEARAELEDVVGEDPYFKDAAHLLRTLPSPPLPDEIWHGSKGPKRIALTFDDGPNLRHTPLLLNVLDALKTRATFMVVGKQAVQYPDVIRRMAASGHEVENHTWNHRNLRKLSEAEALMELASTKRLVYALTGTATRFFRPPGGNIGPAAHKAAKALNMSAVMWTFASGKAEGLPVEDMVPKFVRAARPGAIFLIHNGTDKMEALVALVIKALRARGYEFVRLDELIADR